MNFADLVKRRHSIRKFTKKEVDKDKLKKILQAASSAPSAGNLQAYQIFVVKKQEQKDQLTLAALGQNFIAQAPVVLVFVADSHRSASRYGSRGAKLYCIQDASLACAYAQLMVRDLGMGSTWVGAFDEETIREIVSVSSEMIPVAILPIGYSAVPGLRSQRRNIKDIVDKI